WKSTAYRHPVLGSFGRGDACMLYVDQNDRRGNERVWVGIADSIGATQKEKYGAHNGWHFAEGATSINDPVNYDPISNTGNFVRKHIGMPGTTWDMLGVKASESLNTGDGSLGSRGGVGQYSQYTGTNAQYCSTTPLQTGGKTSKIGPSFKMLATYYKIVMLLSGDLNSAILGPFTNKSQKDCQIIEDFLTFDAGQNPRTFTNPAGFYAGGDGIVEACATSG